jgi:hypothetical protein
MFSAAGSGLKGVKQDTPVHLRPKAARKAKVK